MTIKEIIEEFEKEFCQDGEMLVGEDQISFTNDFKNWLTQKLKDVQVLALNDILKKIFITFIRNEEFNIYDYCQKRIKELEEQAK